MLISAYHIKEWQKEKTHRKNIYGEKCDRNGYCNSIMATKQGTCYSCRKQTETVRHEVYFGANRKTSKAMGFWVNVCPECHAEIHQSWVLDNDLKEKCQKQFEVEHTHIEFMSLIGTNYI